MFDCVKDNQRTVDLRHSVDCGIALLVQSQLGLSCLVGNESLPTYDLFYAKRKHNFDTGGELESWE